MTSKKVRGEKEEPKPDDPAEPVKDEHADPPAEEAEMFPTLPPQEPPANG